MASILYSILNPGDVHVFNHPPMDGVDGIVSHTDQVSHVTADRTYTVQLSYGSDGTQSADLSYSSGWIATDDATLQAQLVDSSQPFYWNKRYERTGTETSGQIDINSYTLELSIDPNASPSLGSFTDNSLFADWKSVLLSAIESVVRKNASDIPLFEVVFGPFEKCTSSSKPIIYLNELDVSPKSEGGKGYWREVDARLGIGYCCTHDEADIDWQYGKLIALFDETSAKQMTFDVELNGTTYTDTSWRHLGIRIMNVQTMTGVKIDDDTLAHLMRVKLAVWFKDSDYFNL